MNDKEKYKIINILKDQIQETQQRIYKYKKLSQPVSPENAIGRVSRMDAINNKSIVEAALRESEKKLIKLKLVQKNLNKISFGICSKCKSNIPIGRMLLKPESQHCVNCAN